MDALRDKYEKIQEREAELFRLVQEAVLLLDRIELPGDDFPFCVDLFLPGPRFEGWRAEVIANRRRRESFLGLRRSSLISTL